MFEYNIQSNIKLAKLATIKILTVKRLATKNKKKIIFFLVMMFFKIYLSPNIQNVGKGNEYVISQKLEGVFESKLLLLHSALLSNEKTI